MKNNNLAMEEFRPIYNRYVVLNKNAVGMFDLNFSRRCERSIKRSHQIIKRLLRATGNRKY